MCAACSIISVLTQWGATLVIKLRERARERENNTPAPLRATGGHGGGLGGSAAEGEGSDSRSQNCRSPGGKGAGHHGAAKKAERRRSASQRSSGARSKLEASRGQSRPLVPPYPHGGSNRWPSKQEGSAFATALFSGGLPSTVTRRPISTRLELQCWLAGGLAFSSTEPLEVFAAAAIIAGHAVAAHTGAPARLLAAGTEPIRRRPGSVCT